MRAREARDGLVRARYVPTQRLIRPQQLVQDEVYLLAGGVCNAGQLFEHDLAFLLHLLRVEDG